jgi:hypothetical protein
MKKNYDLLPADLLCKQKENNKRMSLGTSRRKKEYNKQNMNITHWTSQA